MMINKELLDLTTYKAKLSDRLRMNYDLRTSKEDHSQRMLNAVEPGTIMPIHRHLYTTEVIFILRGAIREIFYNNDGVEIESIIIKAGSETMGICVPVGVWHNLISLESGTVIFSAKDGEYNPSKNDEFLFLDN